MKGQEAMSQTVETKISATYQGKIFYNVNSLELRKL